jgi:hypothetical protein
LGCADHIIPLQIASFKISNSLKNMVTGIISALWKAVAAISTALVKAQIEHNELESLEQEATPVVQPVVRRTVLSDLIEEITGRVSELRAASIPVSNNMVKIFMLQAA